MTRISLLGWTLEPRESLLLHIDSNGTDGGKVFRSSLGMERITN